jgi:YesN/AraC family two-component response regulator
MTDLKLVLEYTKGLNVLYVEDNAALRYSTKELFDDYFNSVDTASDGQEGLDTYLAYYKKHNRYYDLVITDIKMPGLDGIEMSEEILKKNSMQAIVIISAHNEIEFLTRAIELGISGFIVKPINHQQLSRVLYKTSQAISDHQFVEAHLGQIEELNIHLEEQNRALLAKNAELEKSFRLLNTMIHKEQLSHPERELLSAKKEGASSDYDEQVQDLVHDDLYELKEILLEIDVAVINIVNDIASITVKKLEQLGLLFSNYAAILSFYTFFHELSRAMQDFSMTLRDNPLPENKENIKNVFMLLESFVYVLGRWHDDLSSGDGSRINELDASLISDMHTITNMWVKKAEEEGADDIVEFFDF